MSTTRPDELQAAALAWARRHVAATELDPGAITVSPVPNRGGFVNASFHVTDAARRYHLKLAPAGECAGLETWRRVHARLTDLYRAPQMIAWGAVPETSGFGALFEHLEGSPPTSLADGLVDDLVGVLRELHADRELAAALVGSGTCLDHYFENHDRRFRGDLEGIQSAPPPFLRDAHVRWMWSEVERLAAIVRGSPAFQEPATATVHGDLWLDNLLVTDSGNVRVLDWDDLRLGDRVLDIATLFGPSPNDVRPVDESALPRNLFLNTVELERLRIYAPATLLDWVVDPLADWVEVDGRVHDPVRVRADKERVHRAALALYMRRYAPT